jgi:hypothetical protein
VETAAELAHGDCRISAAAKCIAQNLRRTQIAEEGVSGIKFPASPNAPLDVINTPQRLENRTDFVSAA